MMSALSEVRRARPLLGTFVEIVTSGLAEADSHRAIDAAFAAVEQVQRRMSFHEPESTLSRLNREAAAVSVEVDEWTLAVLETAREVFDVSRGVFDVTIARELQASGFLPAEEFPAEDAAPDAFSFGDVEFLPGRRIRFHHPQLRIDLGGIAKGFAVDQAVAALRSAGVPRGLVNAGGDLRAFGREPFPVSIRHPLQPGAAFATILLADRALATSAHSFVGEAVPGCQVGPFVDPHTRRMEPQALSVTVSAPSAIVADALTKVVMLAPTGSAEVLEYFDAEAIWVAIDGTTHFSSHSHAAFELSA